ncbi:MAG TPA: ATP-binding protein, partial [Gemmataceae bacterium]|nr:ATP-binding protein [Gemmataceae bacterium]
DRLREEAAREKKIAQDLAEADRRKDEFLAMLAHELRNPLAPLRNALELLRLNQNDAAAVGQARDMAERQVRQLARLVDDLLDVSRITHGKINLQKEPVEFRRVVERAVESTRPLIAERRHRLEVSAPPEPLWLDADPTRLEQVLANLLNNAAKYTPEGGRIWLEAGRESGEVVARVRDTGIGIAPEMRGRIFELFAQADRSVASPSQWGLGIGLALVKRLVEMHGGAVECHSAGPNQGSEFVVRLPLLREGPCPKPAPRPAACAAPGPGLHVLVVDDNADAAESLAMLLRLKGHDVRLAHDGPSALRAAHDRPPDVAVLDIGLPGMSGYDLAKALRQEAGLDRALLVALTGYGHDEDRRRSAAAGFDHHLVKPVEPEALQALLAEAAGRLAAAHSDL